jgi:hypothetical protein
MGVFDGKYQAFRDFKKRVLDIGIKEVNIISPICVSPEIERINQKVTRIRFRLKNNFDESTPRLNKIFIDKELNQILTDTFGFSEQMVVEINSKYDVSYIREKIAIITKSESFISGKIRGLAGYLIEALKKDYKISKSSNDVINEHTKLQEAQEREKKEKEGKQAQRYKEYINKKINTYLSNLTEEQKMELMDKFGNFMNEQNSILRNWYRKHGLEHPAIKGSFHNFIVENKQNESETILSMEEYVGLLE